MKRPTPLRAASSRRSPRDEPPVIATCEGLLAEVGAAGASPETRGALADTVAARLEARTGRAWSARSLSSREGRSVLFAPAGDALALAESWSLARWLRDAREIAECEPALATPGLEPPPALRAALVGDRRAAVVARGAGMAGERPRSCSNADDWSVSFAAVPQAWRRFAGNGRVPGEGVLVGHPDTGYTEHPTLWSSSPAERRVLPRLGYDFRDHDADPSDSRTGAHPGHGTSTAGVIAGDGSKRVRTHRVQGVAPGARIMPLRVSEDVVYYLSYASVIEAIYYAVDRGAHVISMSLGGPLASRPLEAALDHAVQRGVLLVAAAGNVYPYVVYPGKYDACVCVAAANCAGGLWRWSAEGDAIELSAPGESVWVPCLREGDYAIDRSSGTSHATAATAGAAALWLSFHGRDALMARFGPPGLAPVFKALLLAHGVSRPTGWKPRRAGAGLLDAEGLLAAPLPVAARAAGVRRLTARGRGVPRERFDELAELMPGVSRDVVRSGLLGLFDAGERELPELLDRFGSELAFHMAFDPGIRAALARAGGTRAARASDARRRAAARSLSAGTAFRRDASPELQRALR